ncbi:MAG: bacterial transcriptional activator domain-containing protein [Terriglobales bacterium]
MDAPGSASKSISLILTVALLFFFSLSVTVVAQTSDGPLVERARQLSAQQRWQEVVTLAESAHQASAELDFYYGIALAQLERWNDARRAFVAGARLQPRDKRFPLELAGVAFKQKRYPVAARHLRRALRLDPTDSYGNDFLGTVYFLQGNIAAALKYWNRVGKPQIVEVRSQPTPRVNAALLDRAMAFAPASVLRLPDLLTTEVRVDGLGIFPRCQFDLQARDDGKFDVLFRNRERDGWGQGTLEKLFLLFRGLPFQSITPEIYSLRQQAINFVSMYRWDAEKRRLGARLSSPFQANPKFRYGLTADLRSENWDIRNSFQGPAPVLGSLNMRREAVGVDFAAFESGRWQWSAGAEISHRDFRSVVPGTVLTPSLLTKGYQLKQITQLDAELWRLPERRLTLDGSVSSQLGRIWSQPSDSFEKMQGSLRFHWFPQSQGDDYEIQHRVRAGKTFGEPPFDELFMLGLERDNDLEMRGHIGTRDGRKGSAPLGRNYFLSNWQADKNVYRNGIFTVKLGPFLDTGKITDASSGLGSQKWLWDLGAQATVRVFGVGVVFSYGKDLRSGNNAFYVSMR